MSVQRDKKACVIEKIRSYLSKTNFFIVVSYENLKFDKIEKFRQELNEFKSKAVFAKNTVAKIAFGDFLLNKDIVNSNFFIFGNDIIGSASKIQEFLKENKCSVKVCFYNHEEMPSNSIDALSQLPTLEVARAKMYACLTGVTRNMHQSMSMITYRFFDYLKQVSEKKEE